MPTWNGSSQHKREFLPYFDISYADRYELSSTDGLTLDFIDSKPWHGGLAGGLSWGRSYRDLGELAGKVKPLINTEQGGMYLEFEPVDGFDAGVRLVRDVQNTGAVVTTLYTDIGIPTPKWIETGFRLSADVYNRRAMQRYFGLDDGEASALGVTSYQPAGGWFRTELSYQAYLPVQRTSGLLLTLDASWLRGQAAASPLIRDYGRRVQRGFQLAYIVRF